jgi:diguanylate cyclase (GGDEF)-like protein
MELLYVLCDFGLYIVIVFFALLFDATKVEGFVKLQHALDFVRGVAVRDGVTRSHKRGHTMRLLEEERENAAAQGRTFSLCLLEIDHFKRVNAAHGEAAGDLVLHEVASCARRHLPDPDAFGRYGAAQLLLILPGTTQDAALLLAEQVRRCVQGLRFAANFTHLAPELAVTVSIGVAELRPGETIGQTLARADEALYQATSGARNRVVGYGQLPEPGAYTAAPELFDSTRIDTLTGLLSRRVLRDRLGHAMARALRNGRPVGLMLLNLDKLRDINASFGVAAGDAVLVQAAAQVRSCLHAADTLVRWSGDQFIVILEDLGSAGEAQQAAQRILNRFAFPLLVDERECLVSLSIGIAMFPAPGCDMDALLERAGLAMTRARNWGGNKFQLYALDAVPAPDERQTLKNDLREALGAQQLQIAYQPQVDLAGGHVVGVQALVRWAHPQLGRLEAARFMPLAEETGLIHPIGEWALRGVCIQNAAWRAAGLPPVRTALKLSARQLAHPGMAESILAIVRDTGIDPTCLELQITEAVLAGEQALHEAVLARLRRAGVRVCIDDFGLGAARLRYLAALPVDTLKLGAGVVERLGQPQRDEAAWALAETIVHLARRLDLRVVAEAADTGSQLADLQAIGCDAAQGDVFARPSGADEIAHLLARPSIMPLAACPT